MNIAIPATGSCVWTGKCTECIDERDDMCVDMCIDMCKDMSMGMFMDMWYGHSYGHVHRHVFRHVYRHVCGYVRRHVYQERQACRGCRGSRSCPDHPIKTDYLHMHQIYRLNKHLFTTYLANLRLNTVVHATKQQ